MFCKNTAKCKYQLICKGKCYRHETEDVQSEELNQQTKGLTFGEIVRAVAGA
jgi:phenylalanyl-tRNA synthetase alpha subunit